MTSGGSGTAADLKAARHVIHKLKLLPHTLWAELVCPWLTPRRRAARAEGNAPPLFKPALTRQHSEGPMPG
jgi:hypothetical protein